MTSSTITLTDLGDADTERTVHVFEHRGEDFSVISVGHYVGFRSATAQSMRLRVQTGWLRLAFESDADFDSFTELL